MVPFDLFNRYALENGECPVAIAPHGASLAGTVYAVEFPGERFEFWHPDGDPTMTGWLAGNYCPLEMRDLALVVRDAVPVADPMGGYRWYAAGSDWWGVYPPSGILPVGVLREMDGGPHPTVYPTVTAAMNALTVAADRIQAKIGRGEMKPWDVA